MRLSGGGDEGVFNAHADLGRRGVAGAGAASQPAVLLLDRDIFTKTEGRIMRNDRPRQLPQGQYCMGGVDAEPAGNSAR